MAKRIRPAKIYKKAVNRFRRTFKRTGMAYRGYRKRTFFRGTRKVARRYSQARGKAARKLSEMFPLRDCSVVRTQITSGWHLFSFDISKYFRRLIVDKSRRRNTGYQVQWIKLYLAKSPSIVTGKHF